MLPIHGKYFPLFFSESIGERFFPRELRQGERLGKLLAALNMPPDQDSRLSGVAIQNRLQNLIVLLKRTLDTFRVVKINAANNTDMVIDVTQIFHQNAISAG